MSNSIDQHTGAEVFNMAGLQSVRIQRFKGIEDAPIDLAPFNVLVGANNAGKSSIIQGIHFAVAILQTIALEEGWSNSQTVLKKSLSPNQLIYSPTDDVYSLGLGGTLKQKAEEQIEFEIVLDGGEKIGLAVKKGRNRNIQVEVSNPADAQQLSSLESPFTIFSPGLAGIAKTESWVSDGVLLRTLARGDANLVLRNILLRLWDTPKWALLMVDLHEVFPLLELNVDFREKTDLHISVSVSFGGPSVPLELAGTGVLQAIQILSYVHEFAPKLIVLDEPDSHLHPNNQRLLCALLESISDERGTQVILTTHSRHVIDAVGAGCGFLWVRNGTVDPATADDEVGVLLEIGALDVKERISNPETKAVILTEDTNHHLLQTLAIASGFVESATEIFPYHGVTKMQNLRPLIDVIRAGNPKAKLVLHRDRDHLTDAEVVKWETQVRDLHVQPFVTTGLDVESHYLDAAYLASCNIDGDEEWFETTISQLCDENEDSIIASYVNGRIQQLRQAGSGDKVDAGKIAAEAPKMLKADRNRFALGKSLLKALRHRHQQEFKTSLSILSEDAVVTDDRLEAVAQKVFGKTS